MNTTETNTFIDTSYPGRDPKFWVGHATGIPSNMNETVSVKAITDTLITPSKIDFSKLLVPKEAVKHDDGKTDWSLVPFEALEGMADVLTFGAKKYASWNWTDGGGFSYSRVLRSCLRHIFAFMRGEDNDPESGLSHISHAQCNLLFLAYYIRDKKKFNKDDRNVR